MADIASKNEQQPIILHGDLDLYIISARNLPNTDFISKTFLGCFSAFTTTTTSSSAAASDDTSDGDQKPHHHTNVVSSDPYVTVVVPQVTLARTCVIKNAKNPVWKQRFSIALAHPVIDLEFHVKDDDLFRAEIMGSVKISASKLITGHLISGWFPIVGSSGKQPRPNCDLHLEMKFTPFENNILYKNGIPGDYEQKGVRNTYFPLRKGNQVRLYQDAHYIDGLLPEIELDDGKIFKHQTCWEDLCYAISEAHHMIYIVGWSVFVKIKLIREPTKPLPRGGDLTLGELLKYKSEEGVRVLLMIWDDKSSHDKFGLETSGLMSTHDEETRKFFRQSSVTCVLAPRYTTGKISILKQQIVGTTFTHHQKCVLVDTQAFGNNRKITAFLGGIDLCDGRYDTPEHRLFHDLDSVFKDDFHNPTYDATVAISSILPITVKRAGLKAPREPWHDLHCRIDGPAVYDVLINFEQRWRKAARWSEFRLSFKKKWHMRDDALLKIERISWILSPPLATKNGVTVVPPDDPAVHVSGEHDPQNWHVQIFRSIDKGSVRGFPRDVHESEAQNLICAKDQVIERSIQSAYVQAIGSAQHFIYIENQYFLGSSYGWPSYKDAGADNLIPMELALKIVSKIRAHERFAVYIVVPMWPEGNPKSDTVQEILFWQSQTMQMMYGVIAQEIKSMKLVNVHPRDYLNFYCLGNREENPQRTTNGEMVSESYKNQRFMIYVHAKGMIVDDEYVIIGSANINQRSMAGSKDTEIAMGAYQPHYTWSAKKRHPRGQIYGYRMSLWAEHLGGIQNLFFEPENLECVRRVNEIAENNWKKFTAPNFTTLQGHLLKYPLQVDSDGKVGPLPGCEDFPDAGGKVLGTYSFKVPDILTT